MRGLLLLLILVIPCDVWSRSVSGVIHDANGAPIPFANVQWEGSSIGGATDEQGNFYIDEVPAEQGVMLFSSLGHQRFKRQVPAGEHDLDLGTLVMQDDMLGLDEVVITGTMRETFVKASPIKVEVITAERLQNNLPAVNLMDGLLLVNGVQEVTSCGVCFTNSISINGLPGPYTAVLMDGTPMYGNLASVYGLNGIPTQMIDRFEVVKGPSSTLYGSEAIAGVINIITKDPGDEPTLAFDLMGTSHQEAFGNVALASRSGKWKAFSGINFTYMDRYEDNNGDGFGDMIGMDRLSLFTKWNLDRPEHRKLSIAAKLYAEDRRNGVEEFFTDRNYRSMRGSDSLYGESIYTLRGEIFGTYDLPTAEDVRVDYSMSWHDQDSYYGADHYLAKQGILFSNLVWNKRKKKHLLMAGWTNRYQFYDDNTVATNEDLSNHPERQYIPGIFAETEWAGNAMWTLLGGMRLDYYSGHGIIPSPRASVKYSPSQWTTLRTSAGTGFKIVNLFTEDHAFITGQRAVEIEERLDPERSWNVSANFNHIHALWNSSGMLDIDVYYTRFGNKIVADYDVPGKIIYSNANGFAESYGMAMTFNQQFAFPLAYNLGINLNRASTTSLENGAPSTNLIPYAPQWSGVLTINYNLSKIRLNFAYTANATGPMALPKVFDLDQNGEQLGAPRPIRSQAFFIQNIQITKKFKQNSMEVYGGVQNFLNYRQQESPLIGYNDPNYQPGFSPFFDTSYAYASLHGREVFIGLRVDLMSSSKK